MRANITQTAILLISFDFGLLFFQCVSLFFYVCVFFLLFCFFLFIIFCCCCFCFYCCGSYSRVVVEHHETGSNILYLKNRCILLVYFMGNGKPFITFVKSFMLDLTGFSLQFQVLIDLLYQFSI